MRTNRILYIAGPYSGDIAGNIFRAREVALEVWKYGDVALCPHLNTAHFEVYAPEITWEDYIAGDLIMLSRCDGIIMIPDWQRSRGAELERRYAADNGIPVYFWPDCIEELWPVE